MGDLEMAAASTWTNLFSGDQNTLDAAWALFMNNLLSYARLAPRELRDSILEGGGRWQGSGYGQGNLSRLIYDFTKVAVLATNFADYRDVVLVGLALFWRSASIPKELSGDAKSAAFQLCVALDKDDDKEDEEFTMELPWAEGLLPLSPSLSHIMKNMTVQLEQFERSKLLKDLPYFEGIDREANINNHRRDATVPVERVHRSWETASLNILRLIALLDTSLTSAQPPCDLSNSEILERLFSYALDLSKRIHDYRKQKSIPDATPVKNALFSKEDLALAKQNQSVNKLSSSSSSFSKGSFQMGKDRYANNNYGRQQRPQGQQFYSGSNRGGGGKGKGGGRGYGGGRPQGASGGSAPGNP